jgi:hypothetical protein
MPSHQHTAFHQNTTPFKPLRGIKQKEKDKSALETAVGVSQAGCCARCAEQVKWCVADALAVHPPLSRRLLSRLRKHKYGKFKMQAQSRRWRVNAEQCSTLCRSLSAVFGRLRLSNGCQKLTVKAAYHHMCRGAQQEPSMSLTSGGSQLRCSPMARH